MSGKPAKKAAAAPVTKKKKRTVRKKVASSTARKKSVKASRPKKKAAKNKAVTRKAAAKKTASKKTGRKKTTKKTVRKKAAPAAMDAVAANDATSETKSISWMSAQAASALKAVKASQAEKGQAVLAKNRKRGTEQRDDASLIEIAERMPVDDAALVEFATEEPQQEPAQASTSPVTVAAEIPAVETTAAKSPPVMPPPPPVQPGPSRWPALLGVALVAVLLAYSFWPDGDDSTGVSAATDGIDESHVPAVAATPAVATTAPGNVETPDASTALQFDDTPTEIVLDAWQPSRMPPVFTTTSPVGSAPEPALQQPTIAPHPTPPAAAPLPVTPTAPVATAPAATVPAPGRYRAPGYGYYPQTRQPAYPAPYYR